MDNLLLSLNNVSFFYVAGGVRLDILRQASVGVTAGEVVALLGASGSGKSTALALAGLLATPQAGAVLLAGQDTTRWDEATRARWRRDHLGFVFQFHGLLEDFTARENVMLPLLLQGLDQNVATLKATTMLERLGLSARLDQEPARLSGGEQQRVAIARALVHRPKLLLADEPTGNLDPENAKIVLNLLLTEAREQASAVLLVTHDPAIADRTDRVIRLDDYRFF
ncbi:MAG: ABC transporter ATP-binding protein [Holosporales bacterium]|jgi:lipoprotein-releasing system ATP-binding protein